MTKHTKFKKIKVIRFMLKAGFNFYPAWANFEWIHIGYRKRLSIKFHGRTIFSICRRLRWRSILFSTTLPTMRFGDGSKYVPSRNLRTLSIFF
jgi:hypothetical protein